MNTGSRTEYELQSMPPGFRLNVNYCWFIQIDGGDERGRGQTYHVRMMWFFFDLLEVFGLVDPADWGAVRSESGAAPGGAVRLWSAQ